MSLRASLNGIPASTRLPTDDNLATNQRAQRRDRTNVYMCHLDHLLHLPWAHRQRVPPTEAARPGGPPRTVTVHQGDTLFSIARQADPGVLDAARENHLEGLVAKRLDSVYEVGRRSASWLKVKIVQRQEFVIGGWTGESTGLADRIGTCFG